MAVHTSVFFNAAIASAQAVAYPPLAAAVDQVLGIRSNNLVPSVPLSLVALAATGWVPDAVPTDPPLASLVGARIQTPRTLVSPVYVRPVNVGGVFGDNPNFSNFVTNPVLMRAGEEIAASAALLTAEAIPPTGPASLVAWFCDRREPVPASRTTTSRGCREQVAPTCDRRRAKARGYLRERPIFMGLLRWEAHKGGPCPDGCRRLQPDGDQREIGGLRDEVVRGAPVPTSESYWVPFTVSATGLDTGKWTMADTFSFNDTSSLPAGRYAVLGMHLVQDPDNAEQLLCGRLVIPGAVYRPGALVLPDLSSRTPLMASDDSLGVWGHFDAQLPPTLELFAADASTPDAEITGYLRIAQVER